MDIKEIAKTMTRELFLSKYSTCNCAFSSGLKSYIISYICTGSSTDKCICRACWNDAVKDIKFKGDTNMEVNFIDMIKDSAENGTVYKSNRGVEYKILNNMLCYKDNQVWERFGGSLVHITSLKFTKVEQYKEITAEEALKALREGKEIEFEILTGTYNKISTYRYSCKKMNDSHIEYKLLNNDTDSSFKEIAFINCLIDNGKFYIKE